MFIIPIKMKCGCGIERFMDAPIQYRYANTYDGKSSIFFHFEGTEVMLPDGWTWGDNAVDGIRAICPNCAKRDAECSVSADTVGRKFFDLAVRSGKEDAK